MSSGVSGAEGPVSIRNLLQKSLNTSAVAPPLLT